MDGSRRCLYFKTIEQESKLTKRGFLKRLPYCLTHLNFYPLFIVRAKIMLMQENWLAGTEWDDSLLDEINTETDPGGRWGG